MEKDKVTITKYKKSSGFMQKYAVVIAWISLAIIYSILLPDTFPTWMNIRTMLGSQAVQVVVALAILVPIIAGDYDMSVAATMTLSNMVVASTNVILGQPIGVSIILGILVGIVIGAINGFIVTEFDINPFIVTMGTQTLVAGICLLINQQSIMGISDILKDLVYVGRIAGISYSFFYAIVLCLILYYVFDHTAAGKRTLIVGSSINVAKLSGINVKKVRLLCFIASGMISGIAGVMYTGILGGGHPTSGLSYLMPAFAAVFLGSTCIKIGRFNSIGCIIAVYFLTTGTNGLSLMGVKAYIQNIFYGVALVASVLFAVLARRAQDKRDFKMKQVEREKEIEAHDEFSRKQQQNVEA